MSDFRRPACFRWASRKGIPIVSVFHMGGADVFSFAFRKGQKPGSLKDLEGKTVVLGSAGWQSICDPMLKAAGVDITKVKYVDAGWPTWGTALMSGQGDAALSWEGLRAQWKGQGLDFDYFLGRDFSKLPANSFIIRKADFEDASKKDMYERYFQGWAAGLEFGKINPRAATQIVMEQFPGLASQMTPDVAVEFDDAAWPPCSPAAWMSARSGAITCPKAGRCSSTSAAKSARSPATSRSRTW